MLRMRICWMSGLVVGGLLWGLQVRAADAPQLDVRFPQGQVAGRIADGTRIGQGRITYHGGHVGFQVWAEGSTAGGQPNRYVLMGQQGQRHALKVRLEKEGWQPDNQGGKGIILHAGDDSAEFDVMADGDQTVVSDSYPIDIRGVSLLPE